MASNIFTKVEQGSLPHVLQLENESFFLEVWREAYSWGNEQAQGWKTQLLGELEDAEVCLQHRAPLGFQQWENLRLGKAELYSVSGSPGILTQL